MILSLVSLFTDIASEMLYPVMPVYLKSIGFSIFLIGVLEGLAEAVAGLSKGYFGNISDKIQRRVPFIRAGYIISAVAKPMTAMFLYPVWVFFTRTLDRFGKGIRTSARDAFLSDMTTTENKGRVFGFHRSMDTVGAAIGPLLALLFLMILPGQYRWLFVLAIFPGIIAIILTFILKEKSPGIINGGKRKISFFSYLKYWKQSPAEYRFLVAGLLAFVLFNSSDVFLLLFLKTKGYSDTAMIGFYIFYNLMYAIISYPVGIISDKIGQKSILAGGLIVFAIVYGCYGFASGTIFFGILFLLYGFYAAATEGISKALISNIVSRSDTATAIGFYNSFASIFALAASSLGGFIWFTFSPLHMFVFSSAGTFLAVIYLLVVFRRKSPVRNAV
jgi:MFS family permease